MRAVFILLITSSFTLAADLPHPLPDHPGNVFVEGEHITLPPPANEAKWFDYEGREVAHQNTLPIGYYEARLAPGQPQPLRAGTTTGSTTQPTRITFAVLAPLKVPTPRTSPIGTDMASAWFYKLHDEPLRKGAANLASLAGINWVRDRYSWITAEPTRGHFLDHTTYDDSVRILHDAGLRVLDVSHACPTWASPDMRRFPPDLRDIYRFHRETARRWKGIVDAIEPWNEADFNHTGAEMASFQKASFLGIKAGNPQTIVCMNVFATSFPNVLKDFAANETWPYFDTMNLHHYASVEQYDQVYPGIRNVSAGRPLWVTEFSMPVSWSGDPKQAEPDDATLRLQAERVPMVFAATLNQNIQAAFYFILGHYVEGKTQFGLLHRDLTPRPGYVALAAVGRLLADAKPLGRLKSDEKNLRAFAFHAKPDGDARTVIVAWSAKDQSHLQVPQKPLAIFDTIGREQSDPPQTIAVNHAPVFILLPDESATSLPLVPPPTPPRQQTGDPSPIVLQAQFTFADMDHDKSADRIRAGSPQPIPLIAYNFSPKPAHATLNATVPPQWKLAIPDTIDLPPNARVEIPTTLTANNESPAAAHAIRITADTDGLPTSVLSFNILPQSAAATKQAH